MTNNTNVMSPGEHFSNLISGPHVLNGIILVVGPTGSGKSWFALSLAEKISISLAKKLNKPKEEFFTLDDVSIITLDNVKQLMLGGLRRHQVIILDDISTAYNSRTFMSKSNNILNNILTVFRPNRNILILTLPSTSLVDVVVRRLSHYLIVLERNGIKQGYNAGSLYRITPKPLINKIYHEFEVQDGKQVKKIILPKPSKLLREEYDKQRDQKFQELMKKSLEDWEAMEQKQNKPKGKNTLKDYGTDILALKEQGIPQKEIAKTLGVHPSTLSRTLKSLKEGNTNAPE